jgi:hypothetical protein
MRERMNKVKEGVRRGCEEKERRKHISHNTHHAPLTRLQVMTSEQ